MNAVSNILINSGNLLSFRYHVLALLLAMLCGSAFADDFEIDSSSLYQGTDWFGTGGVFQVADGKLQLTVADANTFMVLLNTGSDFLELNERFSVEVPERTNTAAPGIVLFSTPMPTNDAFGFRFRRQGDFLFLSRFGDGPMFESSLVDPNPLQPLTMFADRISETEFRFGYISANDVVFLAVSNTGINEFTDLHVGVEAFRIASQTFEFDNLSISAIPEPEPIAGDFDGDLVVDCDDLDGYVGNLGSVVTPEFVSLDLDNDGTITVADANTHITTLVQTSNGGAGTFPGDFNCDGAVDVLGDAFVLVGNLGNPVTSYSQGDANFDGTVDVLGDAFILVGNLGLTNGP